MQYRLSLANAKGVRKESEAGGHTSTDNSSKAIQYVIDWIENYFVRL
jgi:hypothetical protein